MGDRPDHTGNVVIQGTVTITGAVTITGTVTITGNVNVTGGTITISSGHIIVDSGSITVSGSVTITTGHIIVDSGSITVSGSVSISAGHIIVDSGSITVSGSVSISSGTVSISGTVNISGPVTVTSGNINVATAGGSNIIIDKLVQGAYKAIAPVTYANDNGVTTPTAPPAADPLNGYYLGKLFAIQCRGWIQTVLVYAKSNTGSPQTLTVVLSPYVGAGRVATVNITVDTTWNWYSGTVNKYWNYDTLHVYTVRTSWDGSLGVEHVGADDTYSSDEIGWNASGGYRRFIRVTLAMRPVGDVPVSGTVNNIQIPNSASYASIGSTAIAAGATGTLLTFTGAGHLVYVHFWADHVNMSIIIEADGTQVFENTMTGLNSEGYCPATPGVSLLKYSTGDYDVQVTLRIEFLRQLRILAHNYDASSHSALARCGVGLLK